MLLVAVRLEVTAMTGRTARRGAALAIGAVWWWAVLRLALAPDAGALEGAVGSAAVGEMGGV